MRKYSRQNSVRIYAEMQSTKFSKELCGKKTSTKFSRIKSFGKESKKTLEKKWPRFFFFFFFKTLYKIKDIVTVINIRTWGIFYMINSMLHMFVNVFNFTAIWRKIFVKNMKVHNGMCFSRFLTNIFIFNR